MYNLYLKLGEAEDDRYRFRNKKNVCNHVSDEKVNIVGDY